MKNAINWFAVPAADIKRAVNFYNSIFGFEMKISDMGGQELAFFPIEDQEGVGGHLFQSNNTKPTTDGPLLYLNGGDDLQKILDKVESSGGKISTPKTQITPEIGYMAIFIDTEGNKMALHSPK
ncbi:MAG TPA: VOC family protein [Ignavibacteria bacterium]|nr:lactoylglutathione lyase [Bacteroidota bacterium]HRI85767.1 VOC family protein [Ignavibacteria bacterium]HRK00253.1 VOC family protein [Ignavibacteria bacterium]